MLPDGLQRGGAAELQWSPLYSGSAERIVESLSADPSLALADTVLVTPLTELEAAQKETVFAKVATEVAPGLGWRRSALAASAA